MDENRETPRAAHGARTVPIPEREAGGVEASESVEGVQRTEGPERPERPERTERTDGTERAERAEPSERTEPSERIGAAIPAYQAAASVGAVVAGVLRLLPEVLVVDDGSTDGTAAAARLAGARVVSLPVNRGKGAALATAFRDLFDRGFTAVVTLDADGQHLPEELPKLLAGAAAGADLVLGVRDHLFTQMSGLRRASNRLSSAAISFAAGQRLCDIQTGFRLYSRRLVAVVGFPESRFEAESAVVVRAVRGGFRVVTVPVRLGFADGRTTSHYRPLVDSIRIARAVIHARFQATRWRRSS